MSNTILGNAFKAVADAIRAKGVTGTMSPLEMPAKVASIPSGGSAKYGLTMDSLFGDVDANGVLQPPSAPFSFSSQEMTQIPAYYFQYFFYNNRGLTSVNLPNLTSVGNYGLSYAFYGCTALTSVDLSSITTFSGSYSLTNAFRGCTSLTSVDLSSLTSAGVNGLNQAFYGCTALTSVDLSNATSVGNNGMYYAFYGCTSLTTVYLSKLSSAYNSFTYTFNGCTHLELVDFSKATAVPELNATNAFGNTNNYYRIVVPNALYNQWIAATNWSDPSIVTHIEKAVKGLVFAANAANSTISLDAVGTPPSLDLVYSTDGGTTFSTYTVGTTVTLANVGDTVMFKAGDSGNTSLATDSSNYHKFTMTGSISIEDDISWLLNKNAVPATTQLPDYAFYGLFNGCSALQNAPELPWTTMGEGCYGEMFKGCTSLTDAPALPATTLDDYCYEGMFYGCTGIETAPTLPSTTLANGCYNEMFYGCSSLNNISLGYTGNFSTTYFNDWVYGVAASGEIEYKGQDTTRGTSAIPSGWTIPTYEYGGLTFTSRQNNSTVKMVADSGAPSVSLQYTRNGRSWNNYTIGDTITVNAGENLGFKATTTNGAFSTTYNLKSNYFVTTGQFDLSGNINSLLNENYDSVTSIPNSCWGFLFKNNTSIIDASNLKFPATTVDNFGYGWMFSECSNMTKGPEIFATNIGSSYGIDHFFYNCSSLTEIKIHYTGSFGGNRFSQWVDGVAASGTFYYNGSDTTRGTNAIPSGWTITPFST